MKVTVSINITPETEKEQTQPNTHQNVSYSLTGFKSDIKADELNDMVYEWLKKQKK